MSAALGWHGLGASPRPFTAPTFTVPTCAAPPFTAPACAVRTSAAPTCAVRTFAAPACAARTFAAPTFAARTFAGRTVMAGLEPAILFVPPPRTAPGRAEAASQARPFVVRNHLLPHVGTPRTTPPARPGNPP